MAKDLDDELLLPTPTATVDSYVGFDSRMGRFLVGDHEPGSNGLLKPQALI